MLRHRYHDWPPIVYIPSKVALFYSLLASLRVKSPIATATGHLKHHFLPGLRSLGYGSFLEFPIQG